MGPRYATPMTDVTTRPVATPGQSPSERASASDLSARWDPCRRRRETMMELIRLIRERADRANTRLRGTQGRTATRGAATPPVSPRAVAGTLHTLPLACSTAKPTAHSEGRTAVPRTPWRSAAAALPPPPAPFVLSLCSLSSR